MDRRTKKKIVKAGAELLIKNAETGKFEHAGYFPTKLDAILSMRKQPGKEFRVNTVRVDYTPIATKESDRG